MTNNDDAMSSYDPYNTNTYKGHKISSDVVSSYEVNTISDNAVVSFKKRKARNISNTKSVRDEDD